MSRTSTKRFIFQHLLVISLLVTLGISTMPIKMVSSLNTPFPHQRIGKSLDQKDFREPSGIVFHPQRGTLFVVGDGGDICEIQRDGTLLRQERIRHADFEGITCDPSTGLLYVAVEGEEKIIEIDVEDFRVLREFTIERTYREKVVLKGNREHGIEAITFVPDLNHPEGGTFYVANQSFDLDDDEEPSAIFEIEVPLKSDSAIEAKAKILRYFSLGVVDLSGLYYEQNSEHLYVISDEKDMFLEVTKEGKVLQSYDHFPGDNQEGIAVDAEGFLYIAQDSGGVIKVKWNKEQ